MKFNTNCKCNIWNSNTHKGFTPPSQGIWQWLVLNNTRPTHLKGKNEYWHVTSTFYYQANQISSPSQFFWKSLWPIYWFDTRMHLCLDAFVMLWQTHGHRDNLGLFKTFNFGMYAGCSNLEWRSFLYTFYWEKNCPFQLLLEVFFSL